METHEISRYIDYTLLGADATLLDLEGHCRTAVQNRYFSVCIAPVYVPAAKAFLKYSSVNVCTVAAFPLGYIPVAAKVKETALAFEAGADEVDFVQNLGYIKNHDWNSWEEEILQIIKIAQGGTLKIILETGLLSADEITIATRRAEALGVNFIKTCTGYGPRGATLEDLRTISAALRGNAKIKASGGIKTRDFALELINAGASRIGTSSVL